MTLTPRAPGRLDGARVLDDVVGWFGRYVLTMQPEDLDLLTVWAAHTWLVDDLFTTPRLQIDSPVPGSGKTTVLEHLQRLCKAPVQMSTVSSAALIARLLETGPKTLLIDEADRSLSPDKEGSADVMATINSGYKRGGQRPVLVPVKGGGWEAKMMPTFAPVCLAGNQPRLPDDTVSRIIRVLLLPDLDGKVDESDWEQIEADAATLAAALEAWATQVREGLPGLRPSLPEGCKGRAREVWAPLAKVAVLAGGRWPDAVGVLVDRYLDERRLEREEGLARDKPAVLLLRHLLELWAGPETFLPTETILYELTTRHPEAWSESSPYGRTLTAHRLGSLLVKNFGVHSTRLERTGPRGYARTSLEGVWRHMRIGSPSETGASGGTGASGAPTPTGTGSAPDAPETPLAPVQQRALGEVEPCPIHGTDHRPDGCWTCGQLTGMPW